MHLAPPRRRHVRPARVTRRVRLARRIFDAAVRAVDAGAAVERHVRLRNGWLVLGGRAYRLRPTTRIFVVGAGKASAQMARAVERLLGARIVGGHVVVKEGHAVAVRRIRVTEAGHPMPDGRAVQAARAIVRLLRGAGRGDIVLCLLSGGGSALLEWPVPSVTLRDIRRVTALLLAAGASIDEVNTVRKRLSRVKGGRLVATAPEARWVTLVVSDVVGDRLDMVASGPTVADPTTFADAMAVVTRYGLVRRLPVRVLRHLRAGLAGGLPEALPAGDALRRRVHHVAVATNRDALRAAARVARAAGLRPLVLTSMLTGEAREAGVLLASVARHVARYGQPVRPPACLLAAGETTVTLQRAGRGGRNQELALSAALALAGEPALVVLSAGTDGTDGPTDVAGAIVDETTLARARARGLNARAARDRHDAYPFFAALRDHVRTGPTGTNVMDLQVIVVG